MSVGSGSGESSPPGFLDGCSVIASSHGRERLSRRHTASSLVSSYKGTNSITRAPTS